MKIKTTKTNMYQILTAVFVGCLLISNVLASKTFAIGSVVLPSAVILFPIVYITNDVLAEIYGFKKTRNMVFLGFIINAVAVIAYQIAILLPAPSFATDGAAAFALTLGSSWRVLLGSFTAYIVGSLLNAVVMVRMKAKLEKQLMLRCILSTLLGESVDALIFISIAFAGTMPVETLFIMIGAQAAFKTVFELVCYPATRLVIKKMRTLDDAEVVNG